MNMREAARLESGPLGLAEAKRAAHGIGLGTFARGELGLRVLNAREPQARDERLEDRPLEQVVLAR